MQPTNPNTGAHNSNEPLEREPHLDPEVIALKEQSQKNPAEGATAPQPLANYQSIQSISSVQEKQNYFSNASNASTSFCLDSKRQISEASQVMQSIKDRI